MSFSRIEKLVLDHIEGTYERHLDFGISEQLFLFPFETVQTGIRVNIFVSRKSVCALSFVLLGSIFCLDRILSHI